MNLLEKLARILLEFRAKLYWKHVMNHVKNCDSRKCQWFNKHWTEDQDETMLCFKGNKLWSKHWDMSYHANSIPK